MCVCECSDQSLTSSILGEEMGNDFSPVVSLAHACTSSLLSLFKTNYIVCVSSIFFVSIQGGKTGNAKEGLFYENFLICPHLSLLQKIIKFQSRFNPSTRAFS